MEASSAVQGSISVSSSFGARTSDATVRAMCYSLAASPRMLLSTAWAIRTVCADTPVRAMAVLISRTCAGVICSSIVVRGAEAWCPSVACANRLSARLFGASRSCVRPCLEFSGRSAKRSAGQVRNRYLGNRRRFRQAKSAGCARLDALRLPMTVSDEPVIECTVRETAGEPLSKVIVKVDSAPHG